jgi:N-dimethylarginine dimethylaminohydrolase
VDHPEALKQWNRLHNTYQSLRIKGLIDDVLQVKPVKDCEDMVFAANQSFPWMMNGEKAVVLGRMKYPSRQKEIPAVKKFFVQQGYKVLDLPADVVFEGTGDCIPHPDFSFLWMGYGHRSELSAVDALKQLLGVDVVTLKLVNEKFYHLDTCFLPLNTNTVLICREAFDPESLAKISEGFKSVIEIPVEEAEKLFALNAHVIPPRNGKPGAAIVQQGTAKTLEALKAAGFTVHELNTTEFMKSGGSVFCMKQMIF